MTIDVVGLLVIAAVGVIGYLIINLIPMDGTLKKIILLIVGLVLFLAVLQSLGVYDTGTRLNLQTK